MNKHTPLPIRHDTVEIFRSRLKAIIVRSGLSRSAFARRVGIDRSTLSQILSGTTDRLPRLETLTAIAAAEQVSIDWLVGLSQQGVLGPEILQQSIELKPGGISPSDEALVQWRIEAVGYKIRYVPATFPDLFKIPEVIDYEYHPAVAVTPEQRRLVSEENLAYERRPETDTEVCSPLESLQGLARGEGIWRDLPPDVRRRQLEHMAKMVDELYPTYRWFLFDALQQFSVPLTIFGPNRAIVYVGQMYLVINSVEHIQVLVHHFDRLIRAATVQPPSVPEALMALRSEV